MARLLRRAISQAGDSEGSVAELIAGLFTTSRYRRSQGKVARQLTFSAMAVAVAVGAWLISVTGESNLSVYGVPLVLLVGGVWACYRIVNVPRFADFLISVEAEMKKVSWPSRAELYRASVVVIIVIFLLAAILYGYDILLNALMSLFFGL